MTSLHPSSRLPNCLIAVLILGLIFGIAPASSGEPRDVFSDDVARFTRLLSSPAAERRVEGIQGLSHLKHWPAEEALLALLDDPSRAVRREALLALNRVGTARSIPRFIRLLEDPWWELRENAQLGLRRMTAQCFPADAEPWTAWWNSRPPAAQQQSLLAALSTPEPAGCVSSRAGILRALRHLADAAAEETLLAFLDAPPSPPLTPDELGLIAETLERVGSPRSVAALARQSTPAAAWALGHLGGHVAEQALLKFPKNLAVWINLDRLKSTNCAPFIPELVRSFGLVTYRSQPDDLHMDTPQPIQRVAANLIVRTGQAPQLIEAILRELEASMDPPLSTAPSNHEFPAEWKPMLEKMHQELKPGFVRGDGLTTSQPLTALYHVADDVNLTPRLIPLLRHPAFVPRIYIAMLLAKLGAPETVPALVEVIQEGYAFSDATELASGKHFDRSQTVRWRGFLCMALGRVGTTPAREALERFATDTHASRDVRYSAVVGLGFIASTESLPALARVAEEDIIWMVRDTARQTAADIQLLSKESIP